MKDTKKLQKDFIVENIPSFPMEEQKDKNGNYIPFWYMQQLGISIIGKNSPMTEQAFANEFYSALEKFEFTADGNVENIVLDLLVAKGLISQTEEDTYQINVSDAVWAVWADDYQFIQAQLKAKLSKKKELVSFLSELAEAICSHKYYPVEAAFPLLRAIVTMDVASQKKILTVVKSLKKANIELYSKPAISSIVMMLSDKVAKDWMDINAPEIKGTIYDVTPEGHDVAGGLGRVEQYHVTAMHELSKNSKATVTFVEPYYRYSKLYDGQETDYASGGNVAVPVNGIELIDTFDISVSNEACPIEINVFAGTNSNGITVYLVRDKEDKYIRTMFKTDKLGEPSSADFNEVFTKASWEFAKRNELKKKQEQGNEWEYPVINLNDAQSLLLPVWKTLDVYKYGVDSIANDFMVCSTTHTYKNRGFIGCYQPYWEEKFLAMGIPEDMHWLFLSKFGEMNISSAGLRCADVQKAVAAVHAYEVNTHDPHINLYGVTNGDNRILSTSAFRDALSEISKDIDGDRDFNNPMPAELMAAKRIVKSKMGLNPDQKVFSYSGRWVPEKAGMERAWTEENLRALLEAGVQVVLFGNVQPYQASTVIGDQMKELEDKLNKEGHSGKLIFKDKFSLAEQIELMAATDMQVNDSDISTGASEITECNAMANGAVQFSPPFKAVGMIANQGRPVNYHVIGEGNTVMPSNSSPESYKEAFLKIAHMSEENLAAYQCSSAKLSQVLEAKMTGAAYLRLWNNAIQEWKIKKINGTLKPVVKRPRHEVALKQVLVEVQTDAGKEVYNLKKNFKVPVGKEVRVSYMIDLKGVDVADVDASFVLPDLQVFDLKLVSKDNDYVVFEGAFVATKEGKIKLSLTSGITDMAYGKTIEVVDENYTISDKTEKLFDFDIVDEDGTKSVVISAMQAYPFQNLVLRYGLPSIDKGWINGSNKASMYFEDGVLKAAIDVADETGNFAFCFYDTTNNTWLNNGGVNYFVSFADIQNDIYGLKSDSGLKNKKSSNSAA